MKRGLFYRPNAMGYTGIKEHAGRYLQADAESHADPVSGVTAVPFDEAPLIAPKCFDDVAVKYLLGCIENRDALISAQSATLEAMASALEFYADHQRYDGGNQSMRRFPDGDPWTAPDAPYLQDVTRDHGSIARTTLTQYRKTGDPA